MPRVLIAIALLIYGVAYAEPYGEEIAARRARFEREGGKPQAVVPLLGLLDLWELVPDRAELTRFVDQAAQASRADVRARAIYLKSLILDRQGKRAEADKLRAGLGMATRFQVVGPFDNEGRQGHAQKLGPETDPGFKETASYEGKERKVSWRVLPAISVAGAVPLDTIMRPEAQVTAYATVAVRVAQPGPAAVRVGSSGAIKVWMGGVQAIDHDVYRPARFDQDAGAVQLRAGWNRLMVKVSSGESGGFAMYVRLTRPDGAPLDGLTWSTDAKDLAAAGAGSPSRGPVADLGRDLAAAAKARPRDAQAQSDLGRWLHWVAPDDPEQHRAAAVLSRAAQLSPTPEAYHLLSLAQLDANDQRKALERGIALAGSDGKKAAALYTAIGELDYKARRDRRAEERWHQAEKADPAYYPPSLRLAELQADRGLPARGAAELDALAARLGAVPLKLMRAQAGMAERRGRRAEADALLAKLDTAVSDDTDALHQRFAFARSRGDIEGALGFNDRLRRVRPDLLSTFSDRSDLLDGVGRSPDALAALGDALRICPDDAKLLERHGRLLHRTGRTADALPELKHSLQIRPQNPELRAYLAELEARTRPEPNRDPRNDLVTIWGEDPRPMISAAQKKKDTSGAPARVLLDSKVTRVLGNGLTETFEQRTIEILDERGARAAGDFDIRYTPDTQSVEVRVARVYKTDGDVVEAISTDDQDLSEPWYGLYYDVRAQVVKFSAIAPGDVIDVQYVVSDVGRRNLFADYYGELHFFQEELPRLDTRFAIVAPKSRQLYFNTPRLAGLQRSEDVVGDEKVYKFRAVDVPKVELEPGMPGYTEVAAYVHVSTYKTWADVASWYRGLVKSQLEPSAAITRAAQETVKNIPPRDERARITAIYDYVVKKTRYVGLEFGIHGYQPYRVSQVFARKFGDCKDKASLLVTMLKEIGIDSTLVLARTRRGGDLDAEPASLAPFDHAIAYVPKYDLYLDGTAEFSGAIELPAQDQDIPVLIVQQGKLARTPVLPAPRNRALTEWRVALAGDGSARIDEHLVISGEAAHEWRTHYQSPGEREDKYSQAWNGKQPGAKIEKLEMSVESLDKPVEVRALTSAPRFARPEGDTLTVPVLGREPDMLRSYARLSVRSHPLVLGYPWKQEERISIALPPGFKVKRLPEARTVETPFAKFTLQVTQRGANVDSVGIVQVDRHRVAKVDYAAWRKFCAEVDAAVSQEMVVGK